ncbi:uncharacterized protein LOC135952239 [Calliphora vicina]|uniref:uncharacterized protein LOC135952239 n=1 Tax=Calliphora vicina TaxID=7373 RepID=UPI00325A668F
MNYSLNYSKYTNTQGQTTINGKGHNKNLKQHDVTSAVNSASVNINKDRLKESGTATSKRRHNRKRMCYKMVDKLSKLDTNSLSEDQKSTLIWAKSVIESYDANPSTSDRDKHVSNSDLWEPLDKIKRSTDDKPIAKWPRVTNSVLDKHVYNSVLSKPLDKIMRSTDVKSIPKQPRVPNGIDPVANSDLFTDKHITNKELSDKSICSTNEKPLSKRSKETNSDRGKHVTKRDLSEPLGKITYDKPFRKRPKITNSIDPVVVHKPFVEIAENKIVMAVINRSNADFCIPRNKWSEIEEKLVDTFYQVLGNKPIAVPLVRDAGWYQGRVKLMAFGDQRSAMLYKEAVNRLYEIWPGAKLDVVPRREIPSMPRAQAWIPAKPTNANATLQLLKDCNPGLPTHNWKIWKFGKAEGNRRQVVVILNAETLPHLAKSDNVVSYAWGQIQLNVYKGDLAVAGTESNFVGSKYEDGYTTTDSDFHSDTGEDIDFSLYGDNEAYSTLINIESVDDDAASTTESKPLFTRQRYI